MSRKEGIGHVLNNDKEGELLEPGNHLDKLPSELLSHVERFVIYTHHKRHRENYQHVLDDIRRATDWVYWRLDRSCTFRKCLMSLNIKTGEPQFRYRRAKCCSNIPGYNGWYLSHSKKSIDNRLKKCAEENLGDVAVTTTNPQ